MSTVAAARIDLVQTLMPCIGGAAARTAPAVRRAQDLPHFSDRKVKTLTNHVYRFIARCG
jgi:hypothetical protein